MKVLLTGDSQLAALQGALEARANDGRGLPEGMEIEIKPLGRHAGDMFAPFARAVGRRVRLTRPSVRKYVTGFPVPGVRTYGVCGPLHTARLVRQMDWKGFAPIGVGNADQAPISGAMFRSLVLEDQKGVLGLLDAMKAVRLRTFVIEAPRPFPHHPVFEYVSREIVLFVDREYRRMMREELAKRSVPVVELPRETYDDDGVMLEKYIRAQGDHHHGNVEFGELMLDAIIQHIGQLKPPATRSVPDPVTAVP